MCRDYALSSYALTCALLIDSENNFAICFPLEIPPRGFPLQMEFSEQYRTPKNQHTYYFLKDFI